MPEWEAAQIGRGFLFFGEAIALFINGRLKGNAEEGGGPRRIKVVSSPRGVCHGR